MNDGERGRKDPVEALRPVAGQGEKLQGARSSTMAVCASVSGALLLHASRHHFAVQKHATYDDFAERSGNVFRPPARPRPVPNSESFSSPSHHQIPAHGARLNSLTALSPRLHKRGARASLSLTHHHLPRSLLTGRPVRRRRSSASLHERSE